MRPLTSAMIAALTGQQTKEVFVVLVTIVHASLPGDHKLRFSSDPTVRHSLTPLIYKTVSRGNDYYFVPMSINLPNDTIGSPTDASLSVSNVGQELISLIRSITTPAAVTLEVVLASDPDTVGISLPTLDMVQADWDENSVNFTLIVESLDREPFPAGNFDQSGFSALF